MKTYQLYSGDDRSNGGASDRSVDDIERDLGQIRSEMSKTLHAIESRLSGGDIVGYLVDQLRGRGGGSGDLLHEVGAVARRNPVPLTLIATGIGAMLLAGQEGTTGVGGRVRKKAEDVRKTAEDELEAPTRRVQSRLHDVQDRAMLRADRAKTELKEGADRAREGMHEASKQGRRVLEEEPLVLAGLGVAFGALISGVMPILAEERERLRRQGASASGPKESEEPSPEAEPGAFALPTEEHSPASD